MARMRVLDPAELTKSRGKSERQRIAEEYDQMLAELAIGQYAEVVPDVNEKRLTVRNRLQRAAERRHVRLEFRRTRNAAGLIFRLLDAVEGNGAAPVAAAAPSTEPRRRGRPRKVVTP